MGFTLDMKTLYEELGVSTQNLERTLTTQRIVEILTNRGLKVLGVYGPRAHIEKKSGRLYLHIGGRVVEAEIPLPKPDVIEPKPESYKDSDSRTHTHAY